MVDNFLKPFVSTLTTVVDYLAQLFGYDGKDLNVSGRVNFASDGNGGVKLASGGVVMPRPGGTLATIGEGGKAEAVIPLDRLDRMMGNRGGGGSTYVINVSGGMSTSAEIGRMIVDNIKKFERASGPVFAGA